VSAGDLARAGFDREIECWKIFVAECARGKKGLARVSDIPGYTKLINFFVVNRTWRLVDMWTLGKSAVFSQFQFALERGER